MTSLGGGSRGAARAARTQSGDLAAGFGAFHPAELVISLTCHCSGGNNRVCAEGCPEFL